MINNFLPAGMLVEVADVAGQVTWLQNALGYTAVTSKSGTVVCALGNSTIFVRHGTPEICPEMPEGYFTGLAHVALRTNDMEATMRLAQEQRLPMAAGEKVNYNPGVWDTGMDYVNPVNPYGLAMEISRRLDLPRGTNAFGVADGLDHIGIPVPNADAEIQFFEKLGFTVRTRVLNTQSGGQQIDCSMVEKDGFMLELYEFLHMQHAPFMHQPLQAIVFVCDSVQAMAEQFQQAGLAYETNEYGNLVLTAPGGEKNLFCEAKEIGNGQI